MTLEEKLKLALNYLDNKTELTNEDRMAILRAIYPQLNETRIKQESFEQKKVLMYKFPNSSNVTGIAFDPNRNLLFIVFHGNGIPNRIYSYEGSPSTLKRIFNEMKGMKGTNNNVKTGGDEYNSPGYYVDKMIKTGIFSNVLRVTKIT